ncbi:MAG: hypothetical protein JW822_12420 [Spirochaetales bacterium]|nr:hypothetical protein [Spirochaetales bacterium]
MWTWNGWIFLVALLLAGIFALAELIAKKNKEAGELIEKVSSYQGYVGIGLIVFSVWNLILTLDGIGILLQVFPLSGIVMIAALVAGILLGIFESIDLFKSWKLLKEEAVDKVKGKLAVIKIPLGFVGIISSLYLMLWGVVMWTF